MIESLKQSYYKSVSQKVQVLSSFSTGCKCYWFLLKTMLKDKKIPVIPPLFHNNKFTSDFKEKSKLFNEHFSKQCSLIQSKSTIPSIFSPLTHKSLSLFQFTANDIKSIINQIVTRRMVMIWLIFEWLIYVVILFTNH